MRFEPLKNLRKLQDVEREYILRTLITLNWNRARTAISLGIAPRTLRLKLAIYRSEGFPTNEREILEYKSLPPAVERISKSTICN